MMNTRREQVVEDYHGVNVHDPYRWLEQYQDPEVLQWAEQQNALTRAFLSTVPEKVTENIQGRLAQLWNYPRFNLPVKAGQWYYFRKNDGLQNQPVLYRQQGLGGKPVAVLDPNTWSTDGTVALERFVPSEDGSLLAYTVSESGSDRQVVRIRDVNANQDLPEIIKWCRFTSIAWVENRGFFYSRFPEPGTVPPEDENNYCRIYWHQLRTDQAEDKLIYEQPEDKELGFTALVTEDQRYLVLAVYRGTDSRSGIYYRELDSQGGFIRLFDVGEAMYSFLGSDDSTFYFLTDFAAPRRRIVAIALNQPGHAHWQELIPEQSGVIEDACLTGGRFVVSLMEHACSKLVLYTQLGEYVKEIALPGLGSVSSISGKASHQEFFFLFTSYTYPSQPFHYDFTKEELTPFGESTRRFDPDRFIVKQVFYRSKDGTQVPLFIMHKKGLALDGTNPTLLYGYGGFNISVTPSFSPFRILWMELGGVFAVANIRGGSEYGEEWHQAGMLANKQNVFDDFIAAAEWLIEQKYTSTQSLAIYGGSNGGLLVSACMIQRPDLYGVVISAVPVTDMLRYHKWTVGRYWIPEYGNADESPEDFHWLYKYSPVHNAKPAEYPATLIITAESDDRVVPAHAYKLTAALQHAQTGDAPILLRLESKAGHGHGKPTAKIIAEQTDIIVFLLKVFCLDHCPDADLDRRS